MTYYNTTHLHGELLAEAVEAARTQDQIILDFFNEHPGGRYTPFEVQQAVLPAAPITSVRRSITNLTDQGRLMKTELMLMGPYGKRSHTWTLKQSWTLF